MASKNYRGPGRRGGPRIVVYLRVEEEQKLLRKGIDPAVWVKSVVKQAITAEPDAVK